MDIETISNFTGSVQLHYHPLFRGIEYTDGVKYVGSEANWLLTDILAQLKANRTLRNRQFTSVHVKPHHMCIEYTDGNSEVLVRQEYDIMDSVWFPITFFYTDGILMLSSEY